MLANTGGERPLVLDREFSYLELLLRLVDEQIHFVIRLNLGSHPPKFWDIDGQPVALTISPGEVVLHPRVWYKGQACVNLIGTWNKGFSEPLWIMTDLDARQGQRIYFARMKIDETFRDLKTLLGLTKLMNKQQAIMEYIAIASLFQHNGDVPKAVQTVNHLLQVFPDSNEAKQALAMIQGGKALPKEITDQIIDQFLGDVGIGDRKDFRDQQKQHRPGNPGPAGAGAGQQR